MDDVRETMAGFMRKAGLHPSLVYAFRKTGLVVAEDSPHSEAERKEFADAVDEWWNQNEVVKGGV
jgi:predicted ATP-grasp superfamily ATP-dependent carboligase